MVVVLCNHHPRLHYLNTRFHSTLLWPTRIDVISTRLPQQHHRPAPAADASAALSWLVKRPMPQATLPASLASKQDEQ